ncbi:response regulator transcription factor [Nocardia sp. NPDC060256]|uniref:helix-turn-helix transcriptional regulator n=1 Tax=unclassified Nocardia TaxID=2637762 RepID=UPI0036565C22
MSTPDVVVTVYDDDPLSRAGVVALLERRRDTVVLLDPGAAGDHRNGNVGLVVVDLLDELALARLRKLVIDTDRRLVLVTGELDEAQVQLVIDAGVQSVIWRHQVTAERLAKAVETASRGEGHIPGDLLVKVLAQLRRIRRDSADSSAETAVPTRRELAVLELLADGLDTKEIAEQLSYSERTVKGVLHELTTRLRLRNRAHAVAFAVREGYI